MTNVQPEPVAPLVEHFFRREAGRLVAVLTRFFGWRNFDLVEEMVQATLFDACSRGAPAESPKTPRHGSIASPRTRSSTRYGAPKFSAGHAGMGGQPPGPREGIDDLFLDTSIEDSQFRMIFACCHPSLRTRKPDRPDS